jgi:hypothetical protein
MTKVLMLSALIVGSIYGGSSAIDSIGSVADNRNAAIEQYTE